MGFLEGLRSRRVTLPVFRTIDGGHPAPYPDMTDEQLYNYETTFNVAKRTFSKPPQSAGVRRQWAEPTFEYAPVPPEVEAIPGRQDVHWWQEQQWPPAKQRSEHDGALPSRERLRRNRAFDAPRYTARKAGKGPMPAETAAVKEKADGPVLDFAKPIRTITTKQAVDIITTRARHPVYKVHAYIGDADVVSVFTLDGRLCENGPHFLENVPELRQLHLNIYPGSEEGRDYRITQHASREEADAAAESGRLTCVAVNLGEEEQPARMSQHGAPDRTGARPA